MAEQMLKVFCGSYGDINHKIEEYIKTGWKVLRFETKIANYDDLRYDSSEDKTYKINDYDIIVTVLFER